MARNEHDAMVAHTLHLKQRALYLDIKDRVTSNNDLSPEFKQAVIKHIDDCAAAVDQIDKQLMQGGGTLVRVSGANIVLPD